MTLTLPHNTGLEEELLAISGALAESLDRTLAVTRHVRENGNVKEQEIVGVFDYSAFAMTLSSPSADGFSAFYVRQGEFYERTPLSGENCWLKCIFRIDDLQKPGKLLYINPVDEFGKIGTYGNILAE